MGKFPDDGKWSTTTWSSIWWANWSFAPLPRLCFLFLFCRPRSTTVPHSRRTFDPRFRFPVNMLRLVYTHSTLHALFCHDDRSFYQRCYQQEGREIKRLLRLTCSEFTFLSQTHSLTFSFYVDPYLCKSYHFFSFLLSFFPFLLAMVLLFFPVYSFFLFCCSVPLLLYANISTPVGFSYVTILFTIYFI